MSELSEASREKIIAYCDKYPSKQAVTLPALHIVQHERRCVSAKAMQEIAEILELAPSQIHDTASFYGFFRDEHRPLGKKRIWVCRSLPCMLRGGEKLLAELAEKWNLHPGETTPDGEITLEIAECLGACDGAPCILIEDELHERVTADHVDKLARGDA